jgi:uncharacterized surface protein with fasciclin (FAS1) repeats
MKRLGLMLIVLLSFGSVWALESNEEMTVLQGLQEDENFSTLVSLLETSGLAEQLSGSGDITLFAPTNEAFAALGEDTLASLGKDATVLGQVLQSHVLAGAYPVLDLSKAEAGTLMDSAEVPFIIEQTAGGLTVNGVNMVATDVDNVYSDGIVHVISEVIVPASMIAADTNGDGNVDNDDLAAPAAGTTTLTDMNNDGVIDGNDVADSNSDGVTDEQDYLAAGFTDSNNDGVIDALDFADTTSNTTATDTTTSDTATTTTTSDTTDSDTMTAMNITDTNNDGTIDSDDVTDSNDDGVIDSQDLMAVGITDMNNDGLVDSSDMMDSNNDGMIDATDMNATNMNATTTGTDDSATDDTNTATTETTLVSDSDTDGQNNCEDNDDAIDSDGDGTDTDQCSAN